MRSACYFGHVWAWVPTYNDKHHPSGHVRICANCGKAWEAAVTENMTLPDIGLLTAKPPKT